MEKALLKGLKRLQEARVIEFGLLNEDLLYRRNLRDLGILRAAVGLESSRTFAIDDMKDGHQVNIPSLQS